MLPILKVAPVVASTLPATLNIVESISKIAEYRVKIKEIDLEIHRVQSQANVMMHRIDAERDIALTRLQNERHYFEKQFSLIAKQNRHIYHSTRELLQSLTQVIAQMANMPVEVMREYNNTIREIRGMLQDQQQQQNIQMSKLYQQLSPPQDSPLKLLE
ncbi:hypothetical protein DC083_04825 [Ignatzschineria ureiclastica]|uniref:Uncharacterized protein n=1 Tax=Ignatzschineria ureiclastica TaxID=472582 RepID=A0A2U2AEZ4_9GAMM|nr:hypothetical protein [Ignatzschineria ureiclastica]PWD81216.1 hypothetical protein DC083_04825 [Ignatzschineria ureiclastica]GGZ97197.1 hypothetical protein GCM10007162_11690 [Ignatzschineria ureiclastica]